MVIADIIQSLDPDIVYGVIIPIICVILGLTLLKKMFKTLISTTIFLVLTLAIRNIDLIMKFLGK